MAAADTRNERIGRTILLSSRLNDIDAALRERGFNVIAWPELAIQPPQSFIALDEAIENLFGYDWLIFINEAAVRFFLERFARQVHDVSELDSLRVCAIGEATAAGLERSQVHVDVIATQGTTGKSIEDIANYIGGRSSLQCLNFLVPQAAIGRDYLKQELEKAESRADVVIAYQTVAATDAMRLSALQSLLLTGSVDAVAFANESDVSDFARLFDASDLSRLLGNVIVLSADQRTATVAAQLGVQASLISETPLPEQVLKALLQRFAI